MLVSPNYDPTAVHSLTTATPTNLIGFIKGNGSVLSADNSTYIPTSNFGTNLQIPFMNGTTAFQYSSNLTYASSILNAPMINIPTTAATPAGIIYQNGSPLIHTYGTYNVFVGQSAGNFTLSGTGNLGFGYQPLTAITSGSNNMAFGFNSLHACTTGISNVAVGTSALAALTTGQRNMALGTTALYSLVSGNENCAVGAQALYSLGGSNYYNTAVGTQALQNLSSGECSTAIGWRAGNNLSSAGACIFIGFTAGYNQTGSRILVIDDGLQPSESARASLSDEQNNAIIYGVMADTASSQTLKLNAVVFPLLASSAPTYVKGGLYFDTTLSKLRVGGLSGWETVTSI